MRLACTFCIPLLLAASVASAGIDLTWNGCNADGAPSTLSFTCDAPFQAYIVGSFNLPAAYERFRALELSIDVNSEAGDLPDFWDFSDAGCNVSGITRQLGRPPACTGATNVWGAGGADGNGTYVYTTPFVTSKRARLVATFFRPVTVDAIDLAAGTDYFGFSFLISTSNASESGGSCAGCPSPIGFVWNWMSLSSETLPDLLVTDPGASGICLRANGAATSSCDAVPASRRTWGALKALYR